MPGEGGADRWFYKSPTGKRGPVSSADLLEMLLARSIPPDSPVWRHGMETWMPAAGVPEFTVAAYRPAATADGPRPRIRLLGLLVPVALLAWAGVIAVAVSRPPASAEAGPDSPFRRLVDIGRKADMEAMPRVIDALGDPDPVIASTAIAVAEGLLGVRYTEKDRTNPKSLVVKVKADWIATQEHLRRRGLAKGATHP